MFVCIVLLTTDYLLLNGMRIGIDARLYKKGLGLGRYVEKLIVHLEQIESDDDFFIFLNKDAYHELEFCSSRFHKVCADVGWYTLKEQFIMPILFLKYSCDIVHIPHFNIPILYPKKMIATFHDLILIKHPQSATSAASTRHPMIHWIKYQAYRLLLWCAVRRVNHIIAVSYGVKNDLEKILHVPSAKISVVYEGVQSCTPVVSNISHDLSKYVNRVYALYVGNSYPHKNVEGLIDLFAEFQKTNQDFLLLLSGQEDYFTKRLKGFIDTQGLASSVIHLGCLSDEMLAVLYDNARFFITCSQEEGFGLPPLEAQSHGVPVIVPLLSVFPEILGNSVLYIDPDNISESIRTCTQLHVNHKLREQYIQRGFNRVSKFRWDLMAQGIYMLYKKNI